MAEIVGHGTQLTKADPFDRAIAEGRMMAIQKKYYLTKDNAQSLMDAVIEEVYSKSVTMFRVELEAAVDELPMVHVEYDAHAHDFAVNDYLQKMGFNDDDDDDINENGTSILNT